MRGAQAPRHKGNKMDRKYATRVETWATRKGRVSKVVVRDQFGTFHGATNFRQLSKVGQIAKARRG